MNEIRDIHNPFCAWLNERGIPFHRNRPDKKTTAIKGDPDFLLTWCNYCVYIECKVPGGKLSKDQEKRIAYLRKAGNPVKIAYSLQDCIEAAKNIFRLAGCENLAGEAPERSGEALGEPLTGGRQTYWIAGIYGFDYVFSGDPSPGGLATKIRRATPQDIRELPRK